MGQSWQFNLCHRYGSQCSLCSWITSKVPYSRTQFPLCGSIANQHSGEQVYSELASQSW